MAKQNQKRNFPHDLEDHQQPPKRTSFRSVLYGLESAFFYPELESYIANFFHPLVREVAEGKFEAYFNLPQSSSSNQVHDQTGEGAVGAGSGSGSGTVKLNQVHDQTGEGAVGAGSGSGTVKLNQVHDQTGEGAVGAGSGSGTVKLKLCFLKNIPSTIFTTNKIEAKDAKLLQVALCETSDNGNKIIALEATHPLSSALIEFVVLDRDFVSPQQREEGVHWSVAEFNKSVLREREGQRPSLVGDDKTTRLNNGAAFINDLSFTQNSSRTRTKMIRLGARIIDDEILAKYPRIGEAVSNPFRVKDHRGEANKKHHPPKGEDEVYRLEGISKDGERHKRLSSKGIEIVDDFMKAYQEDPRSLRELLGKKLSDKKWNEMVKQALQSVPVIPTFDPFAQFSMGNEVKEAEDFNKNLEINDQNIIHPTTNGLGFAEPRLIYHDFEQIYEDFLSWLPRGEASTSNIHNHEVENTNTCNQYFQGAGTQLMQMHGQNKMKHI